MNRRSLFATAAGAFAAAGTHRALAYTGTVQEWIASDEFKQAHYVRFPELDSESQLDFNAGFFRPLKEYRGTETDPMRVNFLKANGYSLGPVDLSYEQCHAILMQHAPYAAYIRLTRTIHEHMWARSLAGIEKHADKYLAAMEATDKKGPGSLELNSGMTVPEYASHEIHEQPGGYVGNPFAGQLYHYAMVKAFYHGLADGPVQHDERNQIMVAGWPTPPDGKLKRILEVGCSHGSTTIALRERFHDPEIEVWALDVGGPQVRYAHHRAVGMGHKINFVQRLAEDTGFPDNYFDMIAINLLFHEVPAFATKKIVPELARITRPGGIWVGDASGTGGDFKLEPTIINKARTWVNHRFNNEVWEIQNLTNDFPTLRKNAGWASDLSTGKPITVKA